MPLVLDGTTGFSGGGGVATSTALGSSALFTNSTGTNLVAIGYQAGYFTTAGPNVFVGSQAGYTNSTGTSNIGIGYQALYSNTTAANNTAVGYQALYTNTAANNTAFGQSAGYANTTGTFNLFAGQSAGQANTTGSSNSFVGGLDGSGISAGRYNTTGSFNTALGGGALGANTTASNNTAVGYQSAYSLVASGYGNTMIGRGSGYSTTSHANTFVGAGGWASNGAGYYVTTGYYNTILGGYDGNSSGLDIRTQNNYCVISDGGGTTASWWQSGGGWYQKNNSASWSTTSDSRIKENIVDIENGLATITALRPVAFDYKINDKKHDIGFIAQEYQQVLPDQVYETTSGGEEIKALTNGEPLLNIQQNLVPYLVSAIKELKTIVDAQAAEIVALKAKVGL